MKKSIKKTATILMVTVAVLLTNCKGKEKDENLDAPVMETPITETPTPEMPSVEDPSMVATESETSGSEDYDKMLDDYDEYVTEYVKFYKKAMKGDQTALAEYPEMMEKATKLQESMQEAQGNNQLSATQIGRMAKIQTKMLQAMQ